MPGTVKVPFQAGLLCFSHKSCEGDAITDATWRGRERSRERLSNTPMCPVRKCQSWDLREAENVCKEFCRDYPGGPGAKNLPSNVGYVGLIPGWGTKLPRAEEQLSSCTQQQLSRQTTAREPAGRREDPLAAAKTRCSRIHKWINTFFFLFRKFC